MINKLTFVLVLATMALAAGVFELKDSVLEMRKELGSMERSIRLERERIQRLEADWAHVARPARLVSLAHQVGMVRADVRHVTKLAHIGRKSMLAMADMAVKVPLPEGREGTFRVKPISNTISFEAWR